jgi:hypothetical protein
MKSTPPRAARGNFSGALTLRWRFRPAWALDEAILHAREGLMGGFFQWLEGAVTYIAAVTGLSVLCFVAMRLLA